MSPATRVLRRAEDGGFNATFEVFPEIKLGDLSARSR
jgi:FKBP-type peptidyl-prolyl cis-trans isomerase (trigger factor)